MCEFVDIDIFMFSIHANELDEIREIAILRQLFEESFSYVPERVDFVKVVVQAELVEQREQCSVIEFEKFCHQVAYHLTLIIVKAHDVLLSLALFKAFIVPNTLQMCIIIGKVLGTSY